MTCVDLAGMAFDDWKNAKVFDKWGYSAFPGTVEDCSTLGLGSDATRCAAHGKEYWQSELTAGIIYTGLNQRGRINDDSFLNFSIESLRHGAHGLMYWQYRKERFGAEFGGFALTDNDGGESNLTRCASNVCKMTQKNEDILMNASMEPAKVALIFSVRSYFAAWSSNNYGDGKYAVDSLSGYYRIFWEENIPVDFLHEEVDLEADLSRYKLIIAPSPYALSPAFAEKIREYIRNGGVFLSDPYFGAFDECMRLSYTIPGNGFEEVFGASGDDILTSDPAILLSPDGQRLDIRGNYQKETYRNVSAEVLYSYEDGSPAIMENRFGQGRAILSGINLGLPYSNRRLISDDILRRDAANSCTVAKDIVLNFAKQAGVSGNFCTAPGVKASVLTADAGVIVMLINSTSGTASGTLPVPMESGTVSEELGSSKASLSEGKLSFTLDAYKSAVIRISRT